MTTATARNSRGTMFAIFGAVTLAAIVALGFYRHGSTQAAPNTAPPPIPVTVTEAAQRDVPIYYDALGTVQALNTVAIRAQVNGQIVSIDFRQGQEVKQGRRAGEDRSGAVQGQSRSGGVQEEPG